MKKTVFTFLCVIILIVCCFGYESFGLDALQNLTDKQNTISSEIDGTNTELGEVQDELSEVMLQLQDVNERIRNYESEVDELNAEIKELEDGINNIESRLGITEMNYQKQKRTLENRLVAIYEAGQTTFLDVLLSSKDIKDFISNYYLLTEITKYEKELLESVSIQRNEINNKRETLQMKQKQLSLAKDSKEKTSIALSNTQTVRNNYMARLTDEEKALQEKIDKYEQEIAEIEKEIKLITTLNVDSRYVGGVMEWPVPGYTRITSTFGMRTHPITGVCKLHTGVDIGAPTGASFIAANDGTVVKAGYNSAYGNMVIIDHGGGVSTLYAHGYQIIVGLGQNVKRGETILKVGSTGYSTGPHAHFEVRINGSYVDPLNYITSKVSNGNSETNEVSNNETGGSNE